MFCSHKYPMSVFVMWSQYFKILNVGIVVKGFLCITFHMERRPFTKFYGNSYICQDLITQNMYRVFLNINVSLLSGFLSIWQRKLLKLHFLVTCLSNLWKYLACSLLRLLRFIRQLPRLKKITINRFSMEEKHVFISSYSTIISSSP